MKHLELTEKSCVVRGSHHTRGRMQWATPENSALECLRYGRIVLADDCPSVEFATGPFETGLVCLRGRASARVGEESFALDRYDALYIPRDGEVVVTLAGQECDLAEISAPVSKQFPLQYVRFADVQNDPGLHFRAGGPGYTRQLNILLGKNIEAGRIVAGVTFSDPGNWTSWPPHEHADLLEEAYVFVDMPPPAWGVQFVYTNPAEPELTVVIREGDCVIMPRGYHPNVAAPGGSINFLWMMAAHREVEDRLFGVVNVQPEYATAGSGLERGRTGE